MIIPTTEINIEVDLNKLNLDFLILTSIKKFIGYYFIHISILMLLIKCSLTQLFLNVNNIGEKYDEWRANKKFIDKL